MTKNVFMNVFMPADILLPKDVLMEKWSVVACDQFSSEREYWERVREDVGDNPSTLNMIIPEAFLEGMDEAEEIKKISEAMAEYVDSGLFREVRDSFVYVERTQPDGRIRRGIVGSVDLEAYDFTCTKAAIRASEGTVLDRLPPRIAIRQSARLELPHIMTLIEDKGDGVIGSLSKKAEKLPVLYDFPLMEGGGHIRGMQVTGDDALEVMGAINALHEKNEMLMVMGDGNHSLAAAKVYWDELKKGLSGEERQRHPSRFALVEVNNVYDDAIDFEAIHRVVFNVDPDKLVSALERAMPADSKLSCYNLSWYAQGRSGSIAVAADCVGSMISVLQEFLDGYAEREGARIDYIHGLDSVIKLSNPQRCLGLELPNMEKSDFFATVAERGVFPKKSFSIGHARDKRYYLECRKLKMEKGGK